MLEALKAWAVRLSVSISMSRIADAVFDHALAAGAKVKRPMADQFYGDRLGGIEDPFGHMWWISTHKEDLSSEEIEKHAAASH